MAAQTEPRGGLNHSWPLGESGWNTGMDANLLKLSRLATPNLYVLDRDLTAPPGGESPGDAYIPAADSTGDWLGHDGEIAIWDGAAYVYYTPKIGWLCYIADEEVISAYKAAGWSAGVAI